MSNHEIINELESIRATAKVLYDRATRLESLVRKGDVSASPLPEDFNLNMAKSLAQREKHYSKNACQ
jgi:hypothetical protein